jgi:AraC-like DNA-binding protein
LRSCQLDGIKVSETSVTAGATLPEHGHDTGQICFLLEGEMREHAKNWNGYMRPGALRSRPPGFRHTVTVSRESDVLALLLFVDAARWIAPSSDRITMVSGQLLRYTEQIRRELVRADDAARSALEGWSLLALSAVARAQDVTATIPPPWLHDAVSMIERRACTPISLSTLALSLGVHRATLAAAFRRFRNTSVGEAIREVRVRKVIHALTGTKMPLCLIATECGFHDQAHMNFVFRKVVGISPGAYRQSRR